MPKLEVITVDPKPEAPPSPKWRERLIAAQLELLLLGGLLLWIGAWWPNRPVALSVPAVLIVWYGLPTRPPFVARFRKDDSS